MCKNNCDCPTRLFKGNPAEHFRSLQGLGITPSLSAESSLLAVMDPHAWVRVWTTRLCVRLILQGLVSSGANHVSTLFLEGLTKAPGCCFVYILPPALPPWKRSLHSQIKGQLSGAGRQLSPPLALSFHSHSGVPHIVRFIAFCVNAATKTNKNSPTPWLSLCPDPPLHSWGLFSGFQLWRDLPMSSQDTSYLICLDFFLLKQFSAPSIWHNFHQNRFPPLIGSASSQWRSRVTQDLESRALEWQMWPADDNARRKSPRVKTLGGGTFWEHSLWKGARYVVMPHRLQRTSMLGLIFILYLLNQRILNTYNVPDLLQSIVKTCTLFLSCYCSVIMSCLTLCDPMDCRMPGFPVLHYLPEFVQTHVHCVDIPALVQKNRWSEHSLTHSF